MIPSASLVPTRTTTITSLVLLLSLVGLVGAETETATAINATLAEQTRKCNCESGKRPPEALSAKEDGNDTNDDRYGFARGELPIRKIYVDGRPVYVRQVVVGPPRGQLLHSAANTTTAAAETRFWEEKRASTDSRQLSVAAATSTTVRLLRKLSRREAGASSINAFSELLADDLQCFNDASSLSQTIRSRRWAFPIPGLALAAPAATAAAVPAYSYGYAPAAAQQYYAQTQPSQAQPQQYYPPQQPMAPAAQNFHIHLPVQSPPPPTLPPPPQTLPPLQPLPEQPLSTAAEYPLPECYTDQSTAKPNFLPLMVRQILTGHHDIQENHENTDDFMCCSDGLERAVRHAFQELVEAGVNICNIQRYTNHIQKTVQNKFNTPFEVINGIGDFASKSHFYHNLICKIESHGRFVLAYATPKEEADEPVDENPASYTLPNQQPQYLAGQQLPPARQKRRNHVYKWKK